MGPEAADRPRVLLVNRCMILNAHGETLLLRRSPTNRHAPHKWEFPGGKLDEGQDINHALEREVLEETGLLVQPIKRLFYVESELIIEGPYAGLPYVVLIGSGRLVGGKLILSKEHDNSTWITPKTAFDFDLKPEIRKALAVFTSTRT